MNPLSRFFIVICIALVPKAYANMGESLLGANGVENDVHWVWRHLHDVVKSCLQSDPACKTSPHRQTLGRLQTYLTTTEPSQLNFISEREHSGRFDTSNESHRLAVTSLKPHATIDINSDFTEVTLETWVGILSHEAVHHLGIDDGSERLPDKIGGIIATHFQKNLRRTDLAAFGHPEVEYLFFSNPEARGAIVGLFHANIFGIDRMATDVDTRPNDLVPICEASEKWLGQSPGDFIWTVLSQRPGQYRVVMKGSAIVSNLCQSEAGQIRKVKGLLVVHIELILPQPLTPGVEWWHWSTKVDPGTLLIGVTDEAPESELEREFVVLELQHQAPVLRAGQVWRVSALVRGLGDMQPDQCGGQFTGSRWPFFRVPSVVMQYPMQSCRIEPLTDPNEFRVTLEYAFAENTQSDLFSLISMEFWNSRYPDRKKYALPGQFQPVEVKNSSSRTPLTPLTWGVKGLGPKQQLGNFSYSQAQPGQEFELFVEFEGNALPVSQVLDLDVFVQDGNDAVVAQYTKPINEQSIFIRDSRVEKTSEGYRMTYTVQFPPTYVNRAVRAVKLRSIFIQTEDFSWSDVTWQNTAEGFIVVGDLAEICGSPSRCQ